MDADRRRWLETLASACERCLASIAETDPQERSLRADVEQLLATINDELDAGPC